MALKLSVASQFINRLISTAGVIKQGAGIIMLKRYIKAAMSKAHYELLPDDGTFYGEIVGFDGVYANSDALETCRDELEEVLEEWILLHVSRHIPLPIINGIELNIREVA